MRIRVNKAHINHLYPTYNCNKKWYGGSYGGFYVHTELIQSDSIVYSFGIGKDITFDSGIMNNHNCKVYGFDPTPKSIEFINSTLANPLFVFFDFGLSKETKLEKFFLPVNKKGVSGSIIMNETVNEDDCIEVKMKNLEDVTMLLGHSHIDVLKIDIEGAEYEVLESIDYSKIKIKQILVEFHDRLFIGEIRSKKTVEILKDNGFEIFGSSLNFEEISFINTRI